MHSNVINYVQYNRNCIAYLKKLYVQAIEPKNHKHIYKRLEEEEGADYRLINW